MVQPSQLFQQGQDVGEPHNHVNSATRACDEAVPLLNEANSIDEPTSETEKPVGTATLVHEARRVLKLAGPVATSELLSFCAYLITTSQVGQLGAQQLSAFTLARTMFHITGLSLVVGLTSGLDTFSGQAFGAQQYKLVGVLMQRAVLLNLLLASALFAGWWLGAEHLMLLLGQDPALVTPAAHLLRLMSPSLIPWAVTVPMHGYFSTQGVVVPLMVLAGLSTVVTPGLNHVFITTLGMGVQGAAVAYNVMLVLDLGSLVLCMVWLHRQQPAGEKTWGGVNLKAAASSWPAFLKIAVPGMAMICLDWWAFEVMVLIAGLQPDAGVQLGAMGVLFATHSLAYVTCSGFGTAVATRVANELGAGNPAAARRAMWVSAGMAFGGNCLTAMLLVAFKHQWALIYTGDPGVVDAVEGSMVLLALSVLGDSLNVVLSGMLRGCGHQAIGLCVNLFTFWLVGLPLSYHLDITLTWGARGVWAALAGVSLLQALVMLAVQAWFSWDDLAARAQQLVASGHGPTHEDLAAAAAGPGGHHGVYEPLLGAPHV